MLVLKMRAYNYLKTPQQLVDLLKSCIPIGHKILFLNKNLEFFIRKDGVYNSISKGRYSGDFTLGPIINYHEIEYEVMSRDESFRLILPSELVLLPKISNTVSWVTIIASQKEKTDLSTLLYISHNQNTTLFSY